MARRGFRLGIPGLGKLGLNKSNMWLWGILGGVGVLAYLAYSGKKTGIGFLDTAAGQFEDVYEDYVGPFPNMAGGGPAAPPPGVLTAPVVPSAGGAGGRGMSFDDMVFSGAYATDSPLPYTDWWNNDTSADDRIIIA